MKITKKEQNILFWGVVLGAIAGFTFFNFGK